MINYLPDAYFQHWLLFVIALYNLLQDRISILDIEEAEVCLRIFVREIKDLYTDREYTYNIHQLLHLGLSVKRWGPLWATSAFPFENLNGYLSKCVHGSKHIGQEIINNITIAQCSKALRNEHDIYGLYNKDVHMCHDERIKFKLLGKNYNMKEGVISETESRFLALEGFCVNEIKIYAKAQIYGDMYTSQIYKITKTNSSNIQITFNDDVKCKETDN